MAAVLVRGLPGLLIFTLVTNLLLLVQPLYMLQVYDRVLPSSSLETLLFISIIAGAALLTLGVVDGLRLIIAGRLAARIEQTVGAQALTAAMNGQRVGAGDVQPLRDLQTVRSFIAGRAAMGLLDLPFFPLFLGVLYLIQPALFWVAVAGSVLQLALTVLNQVALRGAASLSSEAGTRALHLAQSFVRSSESVRAMGMTGNAADRWWQANAGALTALDRVNRINGAFSGLSRLSRLAIQMIILGFGGYLVLVGQMTAGMIFAATLISGRALQPIDQALGGWKAMEEARKAWERLAAALRAQPVPARRTAPPVPKGRITIDKLVVMAPGAARREPLLKGISAEIGAGEFVAVVGPSGAGKSTLVRAIVGACELSAGAVRIDGGEIRNWDSDRLGRHIGYVAQDAELIAGTVAQNISRFDPDPGDAEIVEAARRAGVHDLVLSLPQGYETLVGAGATRLSGGQTQRIALARAFYGDPEILILDEPNSNLDTDGDQALERAIDAARGRGRTLVIVTQRQKLAEKADKLMIMRGGAIEDFGTREAVLERQLQRLRRAQEQLGAQIEQGARSSFPPVVLVGKPGNKA